MKHKLRVRKMRGGDLRPLLQRVICNGTKTFLTSNVNTAVIEQGIRDTGWVNEVNEHDM